MTSGTQKIYAAVKSYSQRGNLLPTEDLRTFAESRDLDELVTRIKNTRYANAARFVVCGNSFFYVFTKNSFCQRMKD